ncbi:MAG: hypothetical protein WCW17_00150 [Patescibacteria group bacterium]|jgi:hypothetical protein
MREQDWHGNEGVDYPISDFVLKNIDSYEQLDARPQYGGETGKYFSEQEFNRILSELLSNVDVRSGEMVECQYYKVRKQVQLDGKPADFVLKIYKGDPGFGFDRLIEDQKIFENYCPNITMPTTFLNTELNGTSREIALQRELKGMTLANYLKKYKKLTPELKAQIEELINGVEEMARKENLAVDDKTLDPTRDNTLIDPEANRFWLVDTNGSEKLSDETREHYQKMIEYLKTTISQS